MFYSSGCGAPSAHLWFTSESPQFRSPSKRFKDSALFTYNRDKGSGFCQMIQSKNFPTSIFSSPSYPLSFIYSTKQYAINFLNYCFGLIQTIFRHVIVMMFRFSKFVPVYKNCACQGKTKSNNIHYGCVH